MTRSRILRPFPDAEAMSRGAAEMFVRIGRDTIGDTGHRFRVALSGGSTPRTLYELLATDFYREQIDWSRADVFWGDERTVPKTDSASNYRMAHEALLSKLPIPEEQVHRIQGERQDLEAAAADYQAEIARVFGISKDGPPPRFDLVLLGLGPDGHTASLFPQTAALAERKRWVVANRVPKLESYRLTLTAPIINRAICIVFIVSGEEKAPAVAAVLEGAPEPERYPAQLIQPEEGDEMWFLDTGAASQLTHQTGREPFPGTE